MVTPPIPLIGPKVDRTLEDLLEVARHAMIPGHVFEELGVTYVGPIDPVIAAVVFDESSEQPEPDVGDVIFPAKPVTINTTFGGVGAS